jgi:23S rRNA pseudouridine1911/1915/1917 synthase
LHKDRGNLSHLLSIKGVFFIMQSRKMGLWEEFTIPTEWSGKSTEELFKTIWGVPKKITHQFRMEKRVLINSLPANWTTPLQEGDKWSVLFHEDAGEGLLPAYFDLEILFEDDHLIVVNKPAGMDTHPNSPGQSNTLLNGLAYHLKAIGQPNWVRHIHRLDRDTTGAILFAKHPLAGTLLDKMLEQRLIKRTYLAKVHGLLNMKKGTIIKPIGRDRHHATRRRVSPSGQDATTHFQLVKLYPNEKASVVKCWLDTGRTHQIRVHFSHIGHPLVGDVLYGGKPSVPRQALHAVKLEFIHPLTKERISCLAPFMDQPPIFSGIDISSLN